MNPIEKRNLLKLKKDLASSAEILEKRKQKRIRKENKK